MPSFGEYAEILSDVLTLDNPDPDLSILTRHWVKRLCYGNTIRNATFSFCIDYVHESSAGAGGSNYALECLGICVPTTKRCMGYARRNSHRNV